MTPLRLREIVNTIAYATVPRLKKEGDSSSRTARPALSAGALHPVSVVIISGRKCRAFRYNSVAHRLELLKANEQPLRDLQRQAGAVLPKASGTLLVLLAEKRRTEQWYTDADSLIWRDAGALLQTIALTATAFRQAFCPIGPLGEALVTALGGDPDLTASGVALIGRPNF
jgi:hypothetical protein